MLHVIPTPLARGAQREARALADQLDAPGVRAHRVLTLFDGPPEVRTDFSLRFDGGATPAVGYAPALVLRLRAALARLDPSLVVAHGGDALKYVVPANVGRDLPLAYYAIGTFAGERDRRLQIQLWRRLARRADVIAAEGDEVAAECSELLGVPASRVTMTPNGRDPHTFFPRAERSPGHRPVVVFVGALTDQKQPHRFVDVVAALRSSGRDIEALLIGDGPLRSTLAGPAHDAGVELLGSRSDVAELLRGADVMVFPSLPTGEGMPGVLIEAGLSGVPVVATDVPGVRTVLDDGTTGHVLGVDDLDGMVAAVDALLADEGRRLAMGEAARARCVARFSLEAVAAQWLAMLQPLLPTFGASRTA